MRLTRNVLSYGYTALVAAFVLILLVATADYDKAHPDSVIELVFLMAAASLLNLAAVRLDRGRLTLTGLAVGAAAILANPLDAALVGLTIPIGAHGQ